MARYRNNPASTHVDNSSFYGGLHKGYDGLYHNILVLTGHWLISRAILIIVCSVVDQSLAQCNTWWVFVNLIIFIGLQLDVAIDDSIQQCTRIVLPYLYDTAFCNMLVLVNISDISGWIYIIPNVALYHNIYTFSRVWPIVYTVLPVTELYLRYYSVVWNCLYLTLILNAQVQFEKKIHAIVVPLDHNQADESSMAQFLASGLSGVKCCG